MTLIHNERTKLAANALDRVSTAFVAVGAVGQALSLTPASATFWNLVSGACWLLAAFALHLIAQRVLGRLKT
jgi:hypothetical protein